MLDGTLEAAVSAALPPYQQVHFMYMAPLSYASARQTICARDQTTAGGGSRWLSSGMQLPEDTRHAVVMSGMSTAEVMEVIGAYSETGKCRCARTGPEMLPIIIACYIGRLLCSQLRCRSRCLGPRCQITMGATCGHCWRRCTTTRTTRRHRTRLRGYTSSSEGTRAVTSTSHSLCLYFSTWNNLYTSTAGGQHVALQEGSTS